MRRNINIVLVSLILWMNVGIINGQNVSVDCAVEYQKIRGFGGMNMPSWISDLTSSQIRLAFGHDEGQIGLSLLRIKVPTDAAQFYKELPTAVAAKNLGALVFATPWSPPAALKSNNNIVGGTIKETSYAAYADHLLNFAAYMATNKASLYAVSLQNEPDYLVTYESCNWKMSQMIDFLKLQGNRFDTLKVIAPESFNFNRSRTDSLLNNANSLSQFDIVGGHVYGSGLSDYPLARQKGKEVWMTEHFTESKNTGNTWPLALDVATELHNCMVSNFNAYVWWYIRRSYGLIDESGLVTKRGYLMAQYARFVRPGSVRVAATVAPVANVSITAFKSDTALVIVAVNKGTTAVNLNFTINNKTVNQLTRYSTSATKNVLCEGTQEITNNYFTGQLEGESVTTFVLKNRIQNSVSNPVHCQDIACYPNPVEDKLNIKMFSFNGCPIVQIFNVDGRQVYHSEMNLAQTLVPTSSWTPGIYTIRILDGERIKTQKIIKK